MRSVRRKNENKTFMNLLILQRNVINYNVQII
jgi:hypothetical protein